jgi:ADP-ribose pyrophosphatase YjhB (NUDIX family)
VEVGLWILDPSSHENPGMALPEDDPLVYRLPIGDGEEIRTQYPDQEWIASWHPPDRQPDGTPHGTVGVCITADGQLVLISSDQQHWGFPGGRPEGTEPPEETLRREILEEACAVMVGAPRLLGFVGSQCVRGPEQGLVLVRSYWRADVQVGPWEPRFEIPYRRLVPLAETAEHLREPDLVANRVSYRALHEAGVQAAGG